MCSDCSDMFVTTGVVLTVVAEFVAFAGQAETAIRTGVQHKNDDSHFFSTAFV